MNNQVTYFNPDEAVTFPHIAEIETLLGGVGRSVFPDGTEQFLEVVGDTVLVYSPRLVPAELERFCQTNLERYQAFHEENEEAIQNYECVPMAPFWE
ncbi:hypothetical protein KZ843_12435 [Pseudomonas aeruginosa]|nr:hypothetical protein [Pseudomonas aeruginosa]MBW6123685.1 hypothetical protein [Pseudomonas aeruginosa]